MSRLRSPLPGVLMNLDLCLNRLMMFVLSHRTAVLDLHTLSICGPSAFAFRSGVCVVAPLSWLAHA